MLPAPELAVPTALAGLAVGSFLNVIIHRTPIDETPLTPRRSYCPHCRAPVRGHDNIPVLSYVLLRGRCRACNGRVSAVYPAVEVGLAAVSLLAVGQHGLTLAAFKAVVFACLLIALTVVDLRTLRLPNSLTGSGVLVGLALAAAAAWFGRTWSPLTDAALAGAVGAATLAVVRLVGSAAVRREAMGLGDVKFLGMIGVFLADGRLVLLTVGLSALVGSVVGLALRAAPSRRTEIPYGPFLGAAAAIAAVWGDTLVRAYVRLILKS
ncbi:MAG: prepilin peptidase [Candidatus Poribacteria bacterium]